MQSERASLEELTRTPYVQVLTYPRISLREAKSRVKQLAKLGVDKLVFEGHARVGRLGILGLGTVRIASMANRVGVGPEIFAHTRDMILMKLLESQELGVWLSKLSGRGKRLEAKTMVHGLLNQCRKLDIMGIDHGQLSNLRKHAVVAEGKPWIIDFESAGTERRPRNVTTAAQYLFVGGALSPALRRTFGVTETEALKKLLADYKHDLSDYSYSKILEHLRLTDS